MATRAETSNSEATCAPAAAGASNSKRISEPSLVERFDAACAATPQPNYSKVADPSIPTEQHPYLVRNSDGIILLAPRAILKNLQNSHLGIAAALQSALHLAAGSTPSSLSHINNEESVSGQNQSQPSCIEEGTSENLPLGTTSVAISSSSKKQNESFFALLGKPPFIPLEELESFTWENSLSKRVIERFVNEASRKRAASSSNSEQEVTTNDPSSSSKEGRQAIQKPESISDIVAQPEKPVDTIVLFAQQEAAASAILRDIRASHAKLRKSASSFRPGEAPVWALLAQKDGKLKPEAAAEMARARVAAAAAAAVMREAATAEHASAASSTSMPTGMLPPSHSAPIAASGAPSNGSHSGDHRREHPNGHTTSHLRSSLSSSVPIVPRSEYNFSTLAPHQLEHANAKPRRKKRVSFAEGTIFHHK